MARARRDPSPPPVERPAVVRSRPPAPATTPPTRRFAATDAELLEDLFGYARRRVSDRAAAEDLTVAALVASGCGTGRPADRAGAFRLLARALAERPDGLADDPDGPAVALFAQALGPDLRDRFERLDLERRRVLTLHYLDRLAPGEMAAVLGTRAAAVQSRLAASLRALERPARHADGGSSIPSATRDEAVSAA